MQNFLKPEFNTEYDPVSFYNKYHSAHAFELLGKADKKTILEKVSNTEYTDGVVSFFTKKGALVCKEENSRKLQPSLSYTPFMLLVKYKFKGNHFAAYTWVNSTYLNAHVPYIRVGVNYFKKISKPDRYGINRIELKRWLKQEITEDHGKFLIKDVPRYDDFIIHPDNKDYQPVIGNMYNMYYEFSHKPKKGDWVWTKRIIEHVFGEGADFDKGIKYLQVLYLYPKQVLPILVLGSKERSTGKSTFLDWMSILFGGNMVVINPADIVGAFNSSYATANIVGIEETVTDKSSTIEKIKNLSTTKFINLNQKFVDNSKIPFFAKLIITTNEPDKFLKIDSEEIRFWIQKLGKPKFKNTRIDEDLIKEIPAFLDYLESLPLPDLKKSRMVFTPEEIQTEALKAVVEESMPGLYKDLKEKISYFFGQNLDLEVFMAHPADIENKFYQFNNNISSPYIRTILKKHFNMDASEDPEYYNAFGDGQASTQRVFTFYRSDFRGKDEKKIGIPINGVKMPVNGEVEAEGLPF